MTHSAPRPSDGSAPSRPPAVRWVPAAVAALVAGRSGVSAETPAPTSNEFRFDLRTDPLPFGGNDHLQSLYLVPPLRGAEIVPASSVYLEGGVESAVNSARETRAGDAARIDGRYWEGITSARIGIGGNLEADVALQASNWKADGDLALVDAGRTEITREKLNFQVPSAALVGGRLQFASFGASGRLSAAFDVRVPFPDAEDDLAVGGGTDMALTVLATGWMMNCEIHANLGVTRPGDESVFLDGVDPSNIIHGGVSAGYPVSEETALIAQLQASSSAFTRLNVLDEPLVSLLGGVRFRFGRTDVTTGIGAGLTGDAADVIWGFRAGLMF